MLNPGKKASGVAILIGGPKREGDSSGDDSGDETVDAAAEGEKASVKSLAKALGADPATVDVDGAVKALRNFLTACGALDNEPDADDKY